LFVKVVTGYWLPAARYPIMPFVRTIAVINQKGGVGKTTTVANIGAALAAQGHNVCLIDLDAQAHLTLHLGAEPGAQTSIYNVLVAGEPVSAAILNVAEHLWLVPSVIDLAAAEIELVSTVGRERILRDRLAELAGRYDFIFIDCPPSLGLLTLNALAAADEVVIPLQPHFLALQGLGKLLETIALVQQRINPPLRVSNVMLCMYESATKLASEVVADLRNFLDAARGADVPWARARILNTVIRRNIKLAECPSHGLTIFDYEPNSNGARDYLAITEEFLACRPTEQTPTPDPVAPHDERPDDQSPAAQPPAAATIADNYQSAQTDPPSDARQRCGTQGSSPPENPDLPPAAEPGPAPQTP